MTVSTIFYLSYGFLWLVVVGQVILIVALSRLVGQLNRRLPPAGARVIDPGPDLGAQVSGFEVVDLTGRRVSVTFPLERGLLILYVSPHCGTCTELLPAARRFFGEVSALADACLAMVTGSRQAQLEYAKRHALTERPVFAEEDLPSDLQLGGAPFALWIDREGQVCAKGMVNTREHLESLRNAVEVGFPSLQSFKAALVAGGGTGTPSARS